MTNYTNQFGGNLIQTANVAYSSITFTENNEVIALVWPSTYPSSTTLQMVFTQIINVGGTQTGCVLVLPDQTQVSVGQTILIQNSGTENFSVYPYAGSQIVVIKPGQFYFLWLYDSTDLANIPHWGSVQYGSITSQANASDLAGKGLLAQGLTLNRNRQTTISAGSYNLQPNDRDTFFIYQGGLGTFMLPDAGEVGNGWQVSVNNNTSSGGVLTVQAQNCQFIDKYPSFDLIPNESITFITDGSNWYSLGYSQQTQFSYGVNNLTLSGLGATYTLTGDQAQQSIQEFNGVLTQNVTVYFPPTSYVWFVTNNTSGAYSVNMQLINGTTPIGNIINITQGESIIIYSDESSLNVIPNIASSSFPLLAPHGDVTAPSYSFSTSENTGMYYDGAGGGELAFAVDGNELFALDGTSESGIFANGLQVGGDTSLSGGLLVSGNTLSGTLSVTGTSSLNGAVTLGQQVVLSSTTALNQRVVFGTTPSLSLGSVAGGSSIQFQTGAGPYTPLMNISASNITFSVPTIFSSGQSAVSFLTTVQGDAADPAFGLLAQETGVFFPTNTSVSFTAAGTETLNSALAANTFYSPISASGAVKTSSFNNLSPCTAAGDMIAYNGTNNVRVPGNTKVNQGLLGGAIAGLPLWGGNPVLQVISTDISANQSITLTNATPVATGITASITPLAPNSKIMVIVQVWGCVNNGTSLPLGQTNAATLQIVRNSTTIIDGSAGIITNQILTPSGNVPNLIYSSKLDSPETTSATTYTVYMAGSINLPTNAYINQSSGGIGGYTSNITLIELGGF